MITKYITSVTTRFNPFSPRARAARLFLALLPPRARQEGLNVTTQLLPRTSQEPSSVLVQFKDGKQLSLDCEKLGINQVVEEVDRHSRALAKQSDLANA